MTVAARGGSAVPGEGPRPDLRRKAGARGQARAGPVHAPAGWPLHPRGKERTTVDYSATMRTAYDRINAGDIEGFGALLADDFVEHEQTPGFPPTKEGVLRFFRMYRTAFPDLRMDAEDVLASGDKTVA